MYWALIITTILAAVAVAFSLFYFNYVDASAGRQLASGLHDIFVFTLTIPASAMKRKGMAVSLFQTVIILIAAFAILLVMWQLVIGNAGGVSSDTRNVVIDWAQSLFPGMA